MPDDPDEWTAVPEGYRFLNHTEACDICGGATFLAWPVDPRYALCANCGHVCRHREVAVDTITGVLGRDRRGFDEGEDRTLARAVLTQLEQRFKLVPR